LFAEKGDSQRARELSTESVGVFRELGDELNAVLSQLNLAWLNLQEGDVVAARELYAYILSNLKTSTLRTAPQSVLRVLLLLRHARAALSAPSGLQQHLPTFEKLSAGLQTDFSARELTHGFI
jgi:hypothetical protein